MSMYEAHVVDSHMMSSTSSREHSACTCSIVKTSLLSSRFSFLIKNLENQDFAVKLILGLRSTILKIYAMS